MNSLNDVLSQKAADLFLPDETSAFSDFTELKNTIYQIKDQLDRALRFINQQQTGDLTKANPDINILDSGERIIEGVFNGFSMVGSDGKEYSVPANYASKSKLVEGDMMKLIITNKGTFIYKQISPIERKRLVGEIIRTADQYAVNADGRTYQVLTASVTFFKGQAGDEAVILVPQDSNSNWAAIENILKK